MNADVEKILQTEPKYRRLQIEKAMFDVGIKGYGEITTLPVELREKLSASLWFSVSVDLIQESRIDSTKKALLRLQDGLCIETVLMGRANSKLTRESAERHTICVSSQVGCPMRCVFCATGSSGFKRNLTVAEIVDQYRCWQRYLGTNQISNIVVMGQGEPLLNYDNIKQALNSIIANTEIGPTKITLSTCGVKSGMEQMLGDKDFPQVRFALSLHSAVESTRARIMPSHQPGFLEYFVDWASRYHKAIPSRTHYIGLEYIMFANVNDDDVHLKALIKLSRKIPRVRINLIPLNNTGANKGWMGKESLMLHGSPKDVVEKWHDTLMKNGFVCTIRRSQGQDIAAACGQLANLKIIDN